MQTYSLAPATVKPELKPIADPLAEMQANIDDLVARMSSALDAIAEAAGAWHCECCGEWTTETIDVANYSDELGYEMQSHCRRCVPAGVEVN
jgi:hypothetical protein